uniref:Uncharacterized protein n=1 Tax=Aureoumbra lagunensis TaxID=44058 RepID=A0A7S3K6X2_9STRA
MRHRLTSLRTLAMTVTKPSLLGVVFDLDGTLTKGDVLDMSTMYARCNIDRDKDILTEIEKQSPEEQKRLFAIIEEMEEEARISTVLATGACDVARWLNAHGIRSGLVSRNSRKTVDYFAENYWPENVELYPRVSRDDSFPPKPDPLALEYIAKEWQCTSPQQICMVGDSRINDIGFGESFGAKTAYLLQTKHEIVDNPPLPNIILNQLIDLPAALWSSYSIESPLGTNAPLLKFDTPQPTHPACIAAVKGNIDQALQDLSSARDCQTPLIWAANAGQIKVVDALLNTEKVDVNDKGYIGATAVSRAARNGDLQVLSRLLKVPGINLNIPNDKLQFPLHFAAFKKHRDAVKLLLEAGASTTVLDRKGRTPAEDTSDPDIRADILAARAARLPAASLVVPQKKR